MPEIYNIYCDESCHLQSDGAGPMLLGAVWCPAHRTRAISEQIRDIKAAHGLKPNFESKWTKVSFSKIDFYRRIVDYFFEEDDLHFRAVLIPNKSILDHEAHDQTHDDFYYKMFFSLLVAIIDPTHQYRIYMDIKDTRSEQKRANLAEFLRNKNYDASGSVIERVQQIRSHESELMQVADLLIGAIGYHNRGLETNAGKIGLIKRIQQHSGKSLTSSTWLREPKFNLLKWKPGGGVI